MRKPLKTTHHPQSVFTPIKKGTYGTRCRRTWLVVETKPLRQAEDQVRHSRPRVEGHVIPVVDADHWPAVVRSLADLA